MANATERVALFAEGEVLKGQKIEDADLPFAGNDPENGLDGTRIQERALAPVGHAIFRSQIYVSGEPLTSMRASDTKTVDLASLRRHIVSANATGAFMGGHILNLLLWAGVAYFCCMAVAHFFGIKVPMLFVYYDTPFYAYQDKIISFAVVAYVCLFASAARSPDVVVAALVAIWVTVSGLCAVNLSGALRSVLPGKSTAMYWLQTGAIAVYALCLTAFWLLSRNPKPA